MKDNTIAPARTYALIVGIEQYALSSDNDLDGPAHDARRFADWLVSRGVPRDNIALLLSPLENNSQLLKEWSGPWKWPATRKDVNNTVTQWLRQRAGDLLWVFWGGHGVMTEKWERRLFYADTTQADLINLELNFLLTHLRSDYLSGFRQEICLIDTCANYRRNLSRERLGYGDRFPEGRPDQDRELFAFFATREGERAKNLTQEHSGLFSKSLLEELAKEPATPWPPDMERVAGRLKERFVAFEGDKEVQQTPIFVEYRNWEGSPGVLVDWRERTIPVRPESYIPVRRNPLFQTRPDEFKQLEDLLFESRREERPPCVGLVGMGGVGKTQLAIQLAYRYEERFPGGVFWMSATGTDLLAWRRQLAELAVNTKYLPRDPDIPNAEIEMRRARHLGSYLGSHADALLILDNVKDPDLMISLLPALAGRELACTVLYTSRNKIAPPGVTTHSVEQLAEEGALRLLLETTRPLLLSQIVAGSTDAEAKAAHEICQRVGYLPLALVHLRGQLARGQQITLERLREVLVQRGALELAKTQQGDVASLFATFWLSWEMLQSEETALEKARLEETGRLFKLACYFPEAKPIPLWLLGLASGLGESGDTFEPLGEVCELARNVSLLEDYSSEGVRLHPLVREFGRRLVADEGPQGRTLLEDAGKRLMTEFTDLNKLERRVRRVQRNGYQECLDQIRQAQECSELLETDQAESLGRLERWLVRESDLLGDGRLWPRMVPGLFYQQLYNRSRKEGYPLVGEEVPACWLRQEGQMSAEDRSLLRIFAGYGGRVSCLAFSSDGTKILTGSWDGTLGEWKGGTVRLWEIARGTLINTLSLTFEIFSMAFSPDGTKIFTGTADGRAQLWETASGKELAIEGRLGKGVLDVVFSPLIPKIFINFGAEGLQEMASGTRITMLWWSLTFAKVVIVAFSGDGTKMLMYSKDGITVFERETVSGTRIVGTLIGTRITTLQHLGHPIALSPDGTKVLTYSGDNTVQLWETTSGKRLTTLQGHTAKVVSGAFSPDGTKILTGSHDRTARLWEVASGNELALLQHIDTVWSIAFSPDGTKILTGSADGTARLWETASVKPLPILHDIGSTPIVDMKFSPNGKQVLTISSDHTMRLWETTSGKHLATWEGLMCLEFSPDGTKILTGSMSGGAQLWETTSGKQLTTLKDYTGIAVSAAFFPNSSEIFISSADGTTGTWETVSGTRITTPQHLGHLMTISPDGTKILLEKDGTLLLWEQASESLVPIKNLLTTNPLVDGRVGLKVAFSPNGERFVTSAMFAQTVGLWETASGALLAQFPIGIGVDQIRLPLGAVEFSPDSRFLIICDGQGQVFLWSLGDLGRGHPLGAYVADDEILAIHWQDTTHVILAGTRGASSQPKISYLKLEGTW